MSEGSPEEADVPGGTESTPVPATDTSGVKTRDWKRLKSVFGNNWVIGVATGLISGIVVAFYLSATGQAALTAVRHGFAKPSCNDPQWLLQVPDSNVFASAYYVQFDQLEGYGSFHSASNTLDGDLNTSWLQSWPSPTTYSGGRDSDYIEWSFAQAYNIRLNCVVDGWAADLPTYRSTLPIGTASVYVTDEGLPPMVGAPRQSDICTSQHAGFQDYLHPDGGVTSVYQWQPVYFHCKTSNVVLRIDGVSRRSVTLRNQYLAQSSFGGPQAHLTGLSEIRFYYCPSALCWLPAY